MWIRMVLRALALAACLSLLLTAHQRPGAGQLVAGTCEIISLDGDRSRGGVARQTARCACRGGQVAGATAARPACVDARIVRGRRWCEMSPCLEEESCRLLGNRSGWSCSQEGGRVKTTTVS
ncbi:chemokine-like protein TAFA-5 [Menidia menidia]